MNTHHSYRYVLEQPRDLSVVGHVDIDGGGHLRQPRHGHNIAGERDHKPRARADPDAADGERKAFRRAELLRVVGEGILRFGDADRHLSAALVGELLEGLHRGGREGNVLRAVDARRNGANLIRQRHVIRIGEGERGGIGVARLLHHQLGQLAAALAALRPDLAERDLRAGFSRRAANQLDLRVGVAGKAVERDDRAQPPDLADVAP